MLTESSYKHLETEGTTQGSSPTLSYKARFKEHMETLLNFLEEILPVDREPEVLWAAMRHGVLNGGKRIRPVLLIETSLACGGTIEKALPTAAALELIHCYSLIHDDLPSIDNDDLRRGQPTVHKAFSEDIALLAGDALIGMAFSLIPDYTKDVPDQTLLKIISELSRAASIQGLVNGQVDDILYAKTEPDEKLLYRIHEGKTGALFRFSCRAGAMLAGQPSNIVDLLGDYGKTLGIAFQIVDDLLDITASSDTLGKTAGKDKAQGKMTFPALFGEDGSRRVLESHIARLEEIMEELSTVMETENLRFLVRFTGERKS